MTLDIEHFHSTINYKQNFKTMLQYALPMQTVSKEF